MQPVGVPPSQDKFDIPFDSTVRLDVIKLLVFSFLNEREQYRIAEGNGLFRNHLIESCKLDFKEVITYIDQALAILEPKWKNYGDANMDGYLNSLRALKQKVEKLIKEQPAISKLYVDYYDIKYELMDLGLSVGLGNIEEFVFNGQRPFFNGFKETAEKMHAVITQEVLYAREPSRYMSVKDLVLSNREIGLRRIKQKMSSFDSGASNFFKEVAQLFRENEDFELNYELAKKLVSGELAWTLFEEVVQTFLGLEEIDKAIEAAKKIIEPERKKKVFEKIVDFIIQQKNYNKALEFAREVSPDNEILYGKICQGLIEEGRYDEVYLYINNITSWNLVYLKIEILIKLTVSQLKAGEVEKAKKNLSYLDTEEKKNALYEKFVHYYLEQSDPAQAELEANLIQFPHSKCQILKIILKKYVELGKVEEAKRLAFSLYTDSEKGEALTLIVTDLVHQNKLEEAKKVILEIPENFQRCKDEALEKVGEAYINQEKIELALELAKKYSSWNLSKDRLFTKIVSYYLQKENLEEAQKVANLVDRNQEVYSLIKKFEEKRKKAEPPKPVVEVVQPNVEKAPPVTKVKIEPPPQPVEKISTAVVETKPINRPVPENTTDVESIINSYVPTEPSSPELPKAKPIVHRPKTPSIVVIEKPIQPTVEKVIKKTGFALLLHRVMNIFKIFLQWITIWSSAIHRRLFVRT